MKAELNKAVESQSWSLKDKILGWGVCISMWLTIGLMFFWEPGAGSDPFSGLFSSLQYPAIGIAVFFTMFLVFKYTCLEPAPRSEADESDNTDEPELTRAELRRVVLAMAGSIALSIYSFVMVAGGIGGFVEGFGQDKVPGWDNWFVNACIWLESFVPPLKGMPYFLLTIVVIAMAVTFHAFLDAKMEELKKRCRDYSDKPETR